MDTRSAGHLSRRQRDGALATRFIASARCTGSAALSTTSRVALPENWVRESWTPRTSSPFTGDRYGYGWFLREMHGHMALCMTLLGLRRADALRDPEPRADGDDDLNSTEPSREDNYVGQLHALVADGIVPALLPKQNETTGSLGTNDPQPSEKPL